MKSRSADSVQNKLVFLAYGATFTGKTTLGCQFAYFKREDGSPFRLAIVDAEGGGTDEAVDELAANGIDIRNIHIFYTQSLQEVEELLNKIKNKETFYEYDDNGVETDEVILDAEDKPFYPDAILIDGTSILKLTSEQGLLELSKKRNAIKADKLQLVGDEKFVKIQGSDLEFKDYKTLNYSGQNLVLDLMAIDINVFLTSREKAEKENKIDKNGKQISVDTGKKIIDSFKDIDYNCKTVLHMFQDEETGQICAEVIKDRTRIHKPKEIVEDPNLLDWEPVVINNKNKKHFVLDNALDKAIEIEQKMYEKKTMGNKYSTINSVDNVEQSNDNEQLAKKIIADINTTLKSVDPVKKRNIRKELQDNGLVTSFKNVTDIEALNKTLEYIKNHI